MVYNERIGYKHENEIFDNINFAILIPLFCLFCLPTDDIEVYNRLLLCLIYQKKKKKK